MKITKKIFKKQMSKIFTGGLLLTMAFLVAGVGAIEKASASNGPSVTITSPNGGEVLELNSAHLITWTQTNVDKVSLSVCYGVDSSTCESIVSSLETNDGTGSYNWDIPSDFLKRADYKISVIAWQTGVGTDSDKSDEVFTIGDSATSTDYSIQLLSQTTDEIWEIGKSYIIQWSNSNPDYIKKMNVSLATVDGTKWHTFGSVGSIEGQTNYSMTVVTPVMDGSDYKVKLRGEKAYNGYLTETVSSDGFVNLSSSTSTPFIAITSPIGGKTFPNGPEKFIVTWDWTGSFDSIGLVLMQNGEPTLALGRMPDAGHVLPGIGSYFGIVSNIGSYSTSGALWDEVGSGFTVRAINLDDTSVFDETEEFSLYNPNISIPKSITVVSPNGGEELKIGETHQVEWNTTGDIDQVTVALNKNGVYVKNLIWNIKNNGSISWTPDLSLEASNGYKIRITDPDSDVYDESNNYFSIAKSSDSTCLPDGTLIKVPNDPKIYVIKNCEKYWIRTAKEFKRKGYKWENVKISTSDIIDSLPEGQDIKEGAIIRTIGDVDIYIVKYIGNKKFKRLILNPSVFRSYGHLRWEDVIEVEEETVNSFATSSLVRNANTGRIYSLTVDGDSGMRRHFKNIGAMQRLGYDLDAVYEINEVDENSYAQGKDLE